MRPIIRSLCTLLGILVLAGAACAMEGISRDQKDRLKSLAEETRVKIDRSREELMRARMDLMQAYGSYQIDERKVRAARERIAKAQLELLKLRLEDQLALRRVLNADQFERFSQMMRRRFGEFRGPHEEGLDVLMERKALGEVDLSSDQRRRLRFVLAPEPGAMRIVEKLHKDTEHLINLYSRYNLDENAARKLIDSIHSSQQALGDLNYKRQQNIRAVLTQAQFEEYVQAVRKYMRDRQWHKPPRGRR